MLGTISRSRRLPIGTKCIRDLHAIGSSRWAPCHQRLNGLAGLPHQSGDGAALQLDGCHRTGLGRRSKRQVGATNRRSPLAVLVVLKVLHQRIRGPLPACLKTARQAHGFGSVNHAPPLAVSKPCGFAWILTEKEFDAVFAKLVALLDRVGQRYLDHGWHVHESGCDTRDALQLLEERHGRPDGFAAGKPLLLIGPVAETGHLRQGPATTSASSSLNLGRCDVTGLEAMPRWIE